MHNLYLYNIRSAFKNAFLPKVNVPENVKRLDIPKDYDFDKLENDIDAALQEIKEFKMRSTANTFFKPDPSVSLNKVLGCESSSVVNTDEAIDYKLQAAVTIDVLNKLSIEELKLKMEELKDAPPMIGTQETARPLITEDDLLCKVNASDQLSNFAVETPKELTEKIIEVTSTKEEKSVSLTPSETGSYTNSDVRRMNEEREKQK